MKRVLFVISVLLSLGMFCACSSDDEIDDVTWGNLDDNQSNQEGLCNAWQLIGYGSETHFHKIAEEYRKKSETYGSRFYLIFNSNGTLTGRDAVNQRYGNYTCNGSIIIIGEVIGTEIYDKEKDSLEFQWRLLEATHYLINKDGKKLRLYYSDKEFLYFELISK
jgi:heat shock protein HslJ